MTGRHCAVQADSECACNSLRAFVTYTVVVMQANLVRHPYYEWDPIMEEVTRTMLSLACACGYIHFSRATRVSASPLLSSNEA